MSNLDLWYSLKPVDRAFIKPITGKSYRGDSPNPTYVIMKLTEQLGPIGNKWGFTVHFDRVRLGAPHQIVVEQEVYYGTPAQAGDDRPVTSKKVRYEIIREEYHEVCIRFWFHHDDGTRYFDAYGGTPMLYLTKKGTWMHDEDAAKKSLTDAYTKGSSWLGACADIFLGLFDDKYNSQPSDNSSPASNGGTEPAPAPQAEGNRQTTTPSGW